MLPDLIGTALAQLATDVSNFVLKSDAAQLEKLQSLSGNCIEFNSTAHLLLPAQSWHLLVTDQGLQFFHGTAPQPQVIVTAAPTELGAWLLNPGGATPVNVDGDQTLLFEFTELIKQIRPDFARPLQSAMGPELANTFLGTADLGLRGLKSVVAAFRDNTVTGDSGGSSASGKVPLATQAQLDTVMNTLDELRLQVDRLTAEIEHNRSNPDDAQADKS